MTDLTGLSDEALEDRARDYSRKRRELNVEAREVAAEIDRRQAWDRLAQTVAEAEPAARETILGALDERAREEVARRSEGWAGFRTEPHAQPVRRRWLRPRKDAP